MSVGSVRSILFTLLVLAGLWVLFLVAAHLILDIEQGRKYFDSLRLTQFSNTGNERETIQEALYLETAEGE